MPAWEFIGDGPRYFFVKNDGSFTHDDREAQSFGNMRMASLFADFRQPAPGSTAKFVVLERIENAVFEPIEIPKYYKRVA